MAWSDWKKKTEAEIQGAQNKNDYTNGYKFGPWLIWMRKFYIIGILLSLLFGISGWYYFLTETDWVGLGVGVFFTLTVSLLCYKINQDYTDSKKGASR